MSQIDAWVATTAKSKLVRQQVELGGPLGPEEVEVQVEHCGLCHSDLSILNNEWGFSQFPAVLGHEIVGRVVEVGSVAKGLKVGQHVGIGWTAGSCMHCRQCKSGNQNLCRNRRLPSWGTRADLPAAYAPIGPGQFHCRKKLISRKPARCSAAESPCSVH